MITQLTLTVTGDRAGDVGLLLEAAGALAVRFEEGAGPPLYDEGVAAEPRYWPRTDVVGFFAQAASADFAEYILAETASVTSRTTVEEQGWEREALKDWRPIPINDHLWIYPSWEEPPPDRLAVTVDPGLAFGTGTHPTTRLCLQWLYEETRESRCDSLLDVGCGSGILAIAALRLGVKSAHGVDIDPLALAASAANAVHNRVRDRLLLSETVGPKQYNLVVANILARPLMELQPVLTRAVAENGRLGLAGVLIEQAEAVMAAYADFRFEQRLNDGWCLLIGTRTWS